MGIVTCMFYDEPQACGDASFSGDPTALLDEFDLSSDEAASSDDGPEETP